MTHCSKPGRQCQRGFSYIELMIAMVVLTVGLLGGIAVICAATANNGKSKLHTTAATLAESTLEKIIALPKSGSTTLTDCQGNAFTIQTTNLGANSPAVVNGFGGTQLDFAQASVAGYSMQYAMCTPGQAISYDVRWRIDAGPTPSTELVTVSAKALAGTASPAATFAIPVTLRGLRGGI
jgi:prepilin-type N-terminal cleavage/methylation domain-containing protein